MRIVLAMCNGLLAASLLVWPGVMLMAVFLIDAPQSTRMPGTVALGASVMLYPVVVIAAQVLFWTTFRRGGGTPRKLLQATLAGVAAPALVVVLAVVNFA